MIAITVFAIGVLAVLRLLTSNLVMMDKTENRTIATFLAKEGIEMVYNMRDSNIQK
jgi:Tfp pilus assembly protein PilV